VGYEAECDTCSCDSSDAVSSGELTPVVSPRFKSKESTNANLKRRANYEDQSGRIQKRCVFSNQIESLLFEKELQAADPPIVDESNYNELKRSRILYDEESFESGDDSSEYTLSAGEIKMRRSDCDEEYQLLSVNVSDSNNTAQDSFYDFEAVQSDAGLLSDAESEYCDADILKDDDDLEMELVDEERDFAQLQRSQIPGFKRFSAMVSMNSVLVRRFECETRDYKMDDKMDDVKMDDNLDENDEMMDVYPDTESSDGLASLTNDETDNLYTTMSDEANVVIGQCESCLESCPGQVETRIESVSNEDPSANEVGYLDGVSVESTVNSEASNLIKFCDICEICQVLDSCHLRAVGYFHTKSTVCPIEEHASSGDGAFEVSSDISHQERVEETIASSNNDFTLSQEISSDWDARDSKLSSDFEDLSLLDAVQSKSALPAGGLGEADGPVAIWNINPLLKTSYVEWLECQEIHDIIKEYEVAVADTVSNMRTTINNPLENLEEQLLVSAWFCHPGSAADIISLPPNTPATPVIEETEFQKGAQGPRWVDSEREMFSEQSSISSYGWQSIMGFECSDSENSREYSLFDESDAAFRALFASGETKSVSMLRPFNLFEDVYGDWRMSPNAGALRLNTQNILCSFESPKTPIWNSYPSSELHPPRKNPSTPQAAFLLPIENLHDKISNVLVEIHELLEELCGVLRSRINRRQK